ncbi:hypothetical protein [Nocardioides sp.]|uniref:hypothetical protein n=1 Tax=Nocardioides sp. TaxID=35761 RepID=UPI00260690A7|nr:hypothetical protein [Nocardioides sp.]
MPILTGLILLANTYWIIRLPDVAARGKPGHAADDAAIKPAALKNRAFLALMTGDGVLGTNQVLLDLRHPAVPRRGDRRTARAARLAVRHRHRDGGPPPGGGRPRRRLGGAVVAGAELFQSAGHWGFMSELTDADQRAAYQGAAHIGGPLGSVWAPALLTFLAMEHGSLGWLTIAAIVVVSTLTMGPSARAAERYLARHGSAA